MLLYLVQHAEAKRKDEDHERGLTDRGFRDIARVALFAKDQGVRINRVLHSGKKRALQTAQILASYLKPESGIVPVDGLLPMDDPKTWAERLAAMNEDSMLVGHLPHLSRLAALLLCGDGENPVIEFRNAGISCMRRSEDGRWAVAWMIAPEMVP